MASTGKVPNYHQKWKVDVSGRGGGQGAISVAVPHMTSDWPNPPGFSRNIAAASAQITSDPGAQHSQEQSLLSDYYVLFYLLCLILQGHLLTKRAWDIALGPIKQIPMNLFMMYMAGSSISIFPIMMVGMMAIRPIKAILSVNQSFKGLEDEMTSSLILQKLVFTFGNCCAISIAVYKCHSMGLLPTHPSDWLDFQLPQERLEFASAGFQWS